MLPGNEEHTYGNSLIGHVVVASFQDWVDVNLRWDPAKYGGVSDLRIPPHRIWKPDILMYNR